MQVLEPTTRAKDRTRQLGRFVLYVIAAIAIPNGVSLAVMLLFGMPASAVYGLGSLITAGLIIVIAPRVDMSAWWFLTAFLGPVVWYPLVRGSWRLARIPW